MSRIQNVLATSEKPLLSVYFTAGYPNCNDTLPILEYLQEAGVSMVEVGMPFSDPLADGPVIQHSSQVALQNGMTLDVLFDQLSDLRQGIQIPVVLMGYLNPVLQYGIERFVQKAVEVGIDGVILPDLPLDEFEAEYADLFKASGLDFIFLVTPETAADRLHRIDALSTAFIYAVSSSSTTGKNTNVISQQDYFKRLRDQGLTHPVMVGFGIRDKDTFEAATAYARGAIIGTAFIQAIEKDQPLKQAVQDFMASIIHP